MKRNILILGGVLMATGASADAPAQPEIVRDVMLTAMAPDGSLAAGANIISQAVDVYDSATGEVTSYYDPSYAESYELGTGANSISSTGIVLLNTSYNGTAAYVEKGELKLLPLPDGIHCALCNSVTPDGSVIAGMLGPGDDLTGALDEDVTLYRPCIWERQSDGTYAVAVELPCPPGDITGRVPQQVLVNGISANGRVVACQMIDNFGDLVQPLVFTKDDEGKWSYRAFGENVIVPEDVTILPFPKEPNREDFRTDFAYEMAMEQWQSKMEKAQAAYDAIYERGVKFAWNSSSISPNGRYYVIGGAGYDAELEDEVYNTYLFDLESGTYTVKRPAECLNSVPTAVADDGSVLAAQMPTFFDSTCMSFLAKGIDGDLLPLQEAVKALNPGLFAWMKGNMYHNTVYWDEELEEDVEIDDWFIGVPCATADFSLITTWVINGWDYTTSFNSYMLPLDADLDGVANVKVDALNLRAAFDASGALCIEGDATAVDIYDLNGRRVFSTAKPVNGMPTGLVSGLYLLKVSGAHGSVVTKAAL